MPPRFAPSLGEPLFLLIANLDPKKRGSLEDQYAALARALRARGAHAHMLFARPPAPSLAQLFEQSGLTWQAMEFGDPLAAAWQVAQEVRRLRPSLVHLHFIASLSPVTMAAAASGAPVVLTDHMALGAAPAPGILPAIRRELRRKTHLLLSHTVGDTLGWPARRVAVSRHVAATLAAAESVPAARLRVIENGIDLARFDRAREAQAAARASLGLRGPAFACIARMAPEKGVDVAIRALALLHRRITNPLARPSLLVVGDGPDAQMCRQLARDLGIGMAVRFLALRNDVESVIAACDQVWVPSRAAEAFGLAAAEGMAMGKPVLASRVGGLPEVVAHRLTGILVPPGDADALAEAARALVDEPARARAMGEAGRRRARERYGLERFLRRTLALYEELLPSWAATPMNNAACT